MTTIFNTNKSKYCDKMVKKFDRSEKKLSKSLKAFLVVSTSQEFAFQKLQNQKPISSDAQHAFDAGESS